jgi:hypothetical protein
MNVLYQRIGGREGISKLLRHFYADVRQDPLIGPIFNACVQENIIRGGQRDRSRRRPDGNRMPKSRAIKDIGEDMKLHPDVDAEM